MVLVQAPLVPLQLLLDGIFIGAIFILIAYGLALVWGVMNVKNLAQGDFVIMGGYIAWVISSPKYMGDWAVHPILGLPVAMVFMFGFGWVIYFLIIKRVVYRDMFTCLVPKCKWPIQAIRRGHGDCYRLRPSSLWLSC
jgi:branched-chain amino acid transport system permease protein